MGLTQVPPRTLDVRDKSSRDRCVLLSLIIGQWKVPSVLPTSILQSYIER